jgi:methylisocitrate lyase
MSAGCRLRTLLQETDGMLRVPGVHDGFSARAAEVLGFEAIYVGGGNSVGTNLGVPDMGLMGSHHLIEHSGRLARTVDIPLIADLDDGGGTPLRVRHAVRDAERAGIAGVHIEDTDFTRGRHFPGDPDKGEQYMITSEDKVIPLAEGVRRIRAAVDGRQDMLIIARTESVLESLEEAIRRCQAYAAEGADLVFVAGLTAGQTEEVAAAVPVPLMNCVDGATAEDCATMESDGLKILFEHRVVPLAAYRAEWEALERFRNVGDVVANDLETRVNMARVTRHREWGEITYAYRDLQPRVDATDVSTTQ